MPKILEDLEKMAGVCADPAAAPVGLPAVSAADFTVGQPVFHPAYGYGEVTAVEGDAITFREKRDPAINHSAPALELITKTQAEFALQATWNACGFQEYRRRMGKWCSITKNLCRYGEWDDVCKRYGLNLRTTNDWIRDFENEMTWQAQDAALAASSKSAESADLNPVGPAETSTSVYAATGARQVNERTPDPDNDEREENKKKEEDKRRGVDPTPHKTMLSVQRRNLDPVRLALYYTIRDAHKKQAHEIMNRKIDEGMAEVLALDPDTANPSILTVLEVRSLLRNQGFKDAEINSVQLDPALGFDALVQSAFDQISAVKGA